MKNTPRPKTALGDNLSSRFTGTLLKLAEEHNVKFIDPTQIM